VRQLIEMFRVRSGCFVVQTYMAAADLIKSIVKGNKSGLFDGYAVSILVETIRYDDCYTGLWQISWLHMPATSKTTQHC
jgi:hypothetical protein